MRSYRTFSVLITRKSQDPNPITCHRFGICIRFKKVTNLSRKYNFDPFSSNWLTLTTACCLPLECLTPPLSESNPFVSKKVNCMQNSPELEVVDSLLPWYLSSNPFFCTTILYNEESICSRSLHSTRRHKFLLQKQNWRKKDSNVGIQT